MRSEDETQNQPLDEKDDQSFTETSESSTDVPKISINGDPEEEFEDAEGELINIVLNFLLFLI